MRMFFALARIVFAVPGAPGSAGKKAIIHKLRDKISQRFNASVADVEPNASAGTAVLGVALVAAQQGRAEQELETLLEFVRSASDAAVVDASSEVLAFDDIAVMQEGTLADKEGLKRDWGREDPDEHRKQTFLEELRRGRKERGG